MMNGWLRFTENNLIFFHDTCTSRRPVSVKKAGKLPY
jgi:hypothetical protein